MPIPIDITTINEKQEIEKRKDFLIKETLVLSSKLNQIRYDIRHSKDSARFKLEEQAVTKQINKIKKELEELENNKKK